MRSSPTCITIDTAWESSRHFRHRAAGAGLQRDRRPAAPLPPAVVLRRAAPGRGRGSRPSQTAVRQPNGGARVASDAPFHNVSSVEPICRVPPQHRPNDRAWSPMRFGGFEHQRRAVSAAPSGTAARLLSLRAMFSGPSQHVPRLRCGATIHLPGSVWRGAVRFCPNSGRQPRTILRSAETTPNCTCLLAGCAGGYRDCRHRLKP
jgi:hypothetical protein